MCQVFSTGAVNAASESANEVHNEIQSRCARSARAIRREALVVVAEGVRLVGGSNKEERSSSFRASLSPLATGGSGEHVIARSGRAANDVANGLQRRLAEDTYALALGPWVRGGTPSAVDRQLGIGYGAGAVQALSAGKSGVMVAFQPPDIESVPLAQAINKVRTVPADSEMMQIARSIGICLGEAS